MICEEEFRMFKDQTIEGISEIRTDIKWIKETMKNGKKASEVPPAEANKDKWHSQLLVEVIRILVAALLAALGLKVVS